MQVRLPSQWISYLTHQPETGMGYQTVTMTFNDGSVLDNVTVLNAEEADLPEEKDLLTIESIEVHSKALDGAFSRLQELAGLHPNPDDIAPEEDDFDGDKNTTPAKCPGCGETIPTNEMNACEFCGRDMCEDCISSCSECGKPCCTNCLVKKSYELYGNMDSIDYCPDCAK